jgi:tetratricopeptide (TPR) repeat protein
MKFINRAKVALRYGKAIRSFLDNNFESAISLFNIILELNPSDREIRYAHYYIGRSYFAIESDVEAKKHMSIAYDLYYKRLEDRFDEKDVEYFKTLAKEYTQLLKRIGDKKLAEKIISERKDVLLRRAKGTP